MKREINVCISCDNNYAKQAGITITSIIHNANLGDYFYFYILNNGIDNDIKNKIKSITNFPIKFFHVKKNDFDIFEQITTHKYITIPSYFRLKIASYFPDLDKIIYLDCDTIINTSLSKLDNIDISNYLLAGVQDIKKEMVEKNPTYVNSGVLVFNLEKIRKEHIEEKYFSYAKENINTIKTGDQEIINEVCKGKIKLLDPLWNVQTGNFVNRSNYTTKPYIIHYVSKQKPWNFGSFSYNKHFYFEYLQKSPWALSKKDLVYWTFYNNIVSILRYVKEKPRFLLRSKWQQAFYYTYIKNNNLLKSIYSIEDYSETHHIMKILWIKIKYPKLNCKKNHNINPYFYYKKNNLDIQKIPKATGIIRKIQLANLTIFKEFDYVCKKNGLKYWIDFGSALGALRHKGFIPWDDDIDIGMMRVDYEKFIDIFNRDTRNPDFYASVKRRDNNSPNMIIKISYRKCRYLNIDIFPYDNFGRVLTPKQRIRLTRKIKEGCHKLNKIAKRGINDKDYAQLINKYKKEVFINGIGYEKETDLVWGVDFYHQWKQWFYSYDTVFPLKEIEFEGLNVPCMNKVQSYLSQVYGNYMSYPKKLGYGHCMYAEFTEAEKESIERLIE